LMLSLPVFEKQSPGREEIASGCPSTALDDHSLRQDGSPRNDILSE
jgi:hypothetical protein